MEYKDGHFMTLSEVASRYNVSEKTISRLVQGFIQKTGQQIDFYKFPEIDGRKNFYAIHDLNYALRWGGYPLIPVVMQAEPEEHTIYPESSGLKLMPVASMTPVCADIKGMQATMTVCKQQSLTTAADMESFFTQVFSARAVFNVAQGLTNIDVAAANSMNEAAKAAQAIGLQEG